MILINSDLLFIPAIKDLIPLSTFVFKTYKCAHSYIGEGAEKNEKIIENGFLYFLRE